MSDIRLETGRLWLNELYARLRLAEAAAGDADLTIVQRRAAIQTAKYLARQIEHWEGQLMLLTPIPA